MFFCGSFPISAHNATISACISLTNILIIRLSSVSRTINLLTLSWHKYDTSSHSFLRDTLVQIVQFPQHPNSRPNHFTDSMLPFDLSTTFWPHEVWKKSALRAYKPNLTVISHVTVWFAFSVRCGRKVRIQVRCFTNLFFDDTTIKFPKHMYVCKEDH